jgi:hypothetical protein
MARKDAQRKAKRQFTGIIGAKMSHPTRLRE